MKTLDTKDAGKVVIGGACKGIWAPKLPVRKPTES
jgi:hypothetical protein